MDVLGLADNIFSSIPGTECCGRKHSGGDGNSNMNVVNIHSGGNGFKTRQPAQQPVQRPAPEIRYRDRIQKVPVRVPVPVEKTKVLVQPKPQGIPITRFVDRIRRVFVHYDRPPIPVRNQMAKKTGATTQIRSFY